MRYRRKLNRMHHLNINASYLIPSNPHIEQHNKGVVRRQVKVTSEILEKTKHKAYIKQNATCLILSNPHIRLYTTRDISYAFVLNNYDSIYKQLKTELLKLHGSCILPG